MPKNKQRVLFILAFGILAIFFIWFFGFQNKVSPSSDQSVIAPTPTNIQRQTVTCADISTGMTLISGKGTIPEGFPTLTDTQICGTFENKTYYISKTSQAEVVEYYHDALTALSYSVDEVRVVSEDGDMSFDFENTAVSGEMFVSANKAEYYVKLIKNEE
jgi:hypothetical protein